MSLALGPFTLGNTIGAGYLGCVGSSILYGITIVLAYMYYIHYPKDWRFQKISVRISLFLLLARNGILIKTLITQVGSLVLFDTIHLAMTIHAIYYYVIIQFGKPAALLDVVCAACPNLGAIFHASGPWSWCQMETWASIKPIAWVVRATFSTSTSIDAVLAASMCYYLHKSKNSFSTTNNRIVTIIRYVLITGSLTWYLTNFVIDIFRQLMILFSAASMASLFTYVAMPDNLIFLGVSFLVTKFRLNPQRTHFFLVYTISYIAMLNSRKASQSGFDSSYSVGRIITGRSAPAHHLDAAGIDVEEDKIGENRKDSLGLSSTSYRARLDQELSSDQKISHHTNTQPEVIGVSVTGLPISLTPHIGT
ncbi:hypothetical protein CVT25_004947 [Psilocybe cyanescens]|uniref:DUF6534 domain-containing protein n=1 Tax=Psilocybe cyanescens TaxID=93625 RepID=A0A409XU85_PSICY|nr:hypothetical protein CVT25_004947 [Psilocybe cyanescens]